jgi:hypothetical protein
MRYLFPPAGKKMKILSTALILLCLTGCVSRKAAVIKKAPVRTVRYNLQSAIKTATERSLDMRVLESLQLIAREHVEKSRLLELPGMIYDLPRRLPGLTVENDYRLSSLDHALESCRILTTQAKKEPGQHQSCPGGSDTYKIRPECPRWQHCAAPEPR